MPYATTAMTRGRRGWRQPGSGTTGCWPRRRGAGRHDPGPAPAPRGRSCPRGRSAQTPMPRRAGHCHWKNWASRSCRWSERPLLLVEGGLDSGSPERAQAALGVLPGDADLTMVAGVDEPTVADSACRHVAGVSGRWFRHPHLSTPPPGDSPTWPNQPRGRRRCVPLTGREAATMRDHRHW
jgi:hypothetical protein